MQPFPFDIIYDATMRLLPSKMNTQDARAMLYAIGMQESRFEHRVQIGGPAHSMWQFERNGGVLGVLSHHATCSIIRDVLVTLRYDGRVNTSYEAIVHNDILACAYARLLLWSDPHPLPTRSESAIGWDYYLRTWQPGKPHPETWPAYWHEAWTR